MHKLYFILALVAGFGLPIQIAINNKLTNFSGNPIMSSFVSFSVGAIALLSYCFTNPPLFWKSLVQMTYAPVYAWLGGLVGTFYIVTTIIASPKIGITFFLGLVIGGQLIMSILIEHYGWFDVAVKPLNLSKGIGVLLVMAGIILIKK